MGTVEDILKELEPDIRRWGTWFHRTTRGVSIYDLCQEARIGVFQHLVKYPELVELRSPKEFFQKVIRNTLIDAYRRNKRKKIRRIIPVSATTFERRESGFSTWRPAHTTVFSGDRHSADGVTWLENQQDARAAHGRDFPIEDVSERFAATLREPDRSIWKGLVDGWTLKNRREILRWLECNPAVAADSPTELARLRRIRRTCSRVRRQAKTYLEKLGWFD